EDEGEELRAVADLGDRNDEERGEEGVHGRGGGLGEERQRPRRPGPARVSMPTPMVSPDGSPPAAPCRRAKRRVASLLTRPPPAEGSYSPVTTGATLSRRAAPRNPAIHFLPAGWRLWLPHLNPPPQAGKEIVASYDRRGAAAARPGRG